MVEEKKKQGFFQKATTFITGKTPEQRQYERVAGQQIRKKAMAGYLKQKEIEAVKLAQQKAIIERESAVQRLRTQMQPKKAGVSAGGTFEERMAGMDKALAGWGSWASGSVPMATQVKARLKKGKKGKRVYVPTSTTPQSFDVNSFVRGLPE